jgi:glutamine amidotransferase
MQMMARSSEEGKLPGLGWIPGEVKKFRGLEDERLEEKRVRGLEDKRMRGGEEERMSLPHMGWNDVVPQEKESLFRGMEAPRFYFLHSYYFAATRSDDVLATTDYHGGFTSAVRAGNVCGTQFHPEKSHGWGIQLLKNFAEM